MSTSQMVSPLAQTPQMAARHRTQIRIWLYGICLLILAMVVVGGATRLTESGLSITEWKPIHGMIPPLSEAEWLEEFDKYRQIPQYQLINKGMSLEEFQFIFWWEWAHRQLGRFIGVAFALPLVFFWATGRIEGWLKPWLVLGLALGGLQGAVGWWMVASGLVERTDVSQYRLAVHLTLACIIFA
ncbi:MAG: COX15/CtaA family protein, partial [Pannonibacter indicus]